MTQFVVDRLEHRQSRISQQLAGAAQEGAYKESMYVADLTSY
ncbi:hypothetical protein [Nonomuraea fuscirosea]|nr:hypothetical protein [Nonomuraea fuscirosea]